MTSPVQDGGIYFRDILASFFCIVEGSGDSCPSLFMLLLCTPTICPIHSSRTPCWYKNVAFRPKDVTNAVNPKFYEWGLHRCATTASNNWTVRQRDRERWPACWPFAKLSSESVKCLTDCEGRERRETEGEKSKKGVGWRLSVCPSVCLCFSLGLRGVWWLCSSINGWPCTCSHISDFV